ncbi:hypothetical protein BMS3Bbin04_01735 [bacterium BMS3Bbin04]|nr:hypothetical protein BMS3Bbin04_01735 [bacterium BMS3Bbin04]
MPGHGVINNTTTSAISRVVKNLNRTIKRANVVNPVVLTKIKHVQTSQVAFTIDVQQIATTVGLTVNIEHGQQACRRCESEVVSTFKIEVTTSVQVVHAGSFFRGTGRDIEIVRVNA